MSTNSSSNLAPQGDKSNTVAHTPGEWFYTGTVEDHRGNPCVTDSLNLVVAIALDDGKEAEEVEANAHLIAAAPSLLEALRQFAQLPLPSEMHAADDWHSTMDRHLHVILTDAISAARSAIQRAEGGQ